MSLVDYINDLGGDSSFTARKTLWTFWNPSELYTGTATQNTEFLEALKRFHEQGPQLTLQAEQVATGSEVKVKADRDVTVSSFLSRSSFGAEANEEVSLGDAEFGNFPIQATDGTREFSGELFLWPSGDSQLEASLLAASQTQTNVADPTPDQQTLIGKFIDGLTVDRLKQAASEKAPLWIASNVNAMTVTALSCIVTPPIACAMSGGKHGLDFGFAVARELVRTAPDLSNAEKTALDQIFFAMNTGVQLIGLDVFSPSKAVKVCNAIELSATVGNLIAAEIEIDSVSFTAQILISETKKISMLFCDFVPN